MAPLNAEERMRYSVQEIQREKLKEWEFSHKELKSKFNECRNVHIGFTALGTALLGGGALTDNWGVITAVGFTLLTIGNVCAVPYTFSTYSDLRDFQKNNPKPEVP